MTDLDGSRPDGDLVAIAAEVCKAITVHARACATEPRNGPVVVPAAFALREALGTYARAVTAVSGWSDPISGYDLPVEDDEDDENNEEAAEESEGVEADVMVFDHYFLKVDDPEEFLRYASQRFGREFQNMDEAAEALCEADSWRPEDYPGAISVNLHNIDTCFS